MTFIKLLKDASYSRVMGGIIFDSHHKPIPRDQLEDLGVKIENGKGSKTYYHLNEETSVLTRFDLCKDNTYCMGSKCEITAGKLNHMQLAYEIATGFDIRLTHTRVPMFGNDSLV